MPGGADDIKNKLKEIKEFAEKHPVVTDVIDMGVLLKIEERYSEDESIRRSIDSDIGKVTGLKMVTGYSIEEAENPKNRKKNPENVDILNKLSSLLTELMSTLYNYGNPTLDISKSREIKEDDFNNGLRESLRNSIVLRISTERSASQDRIMKMLADTGVSCVLEDEKVPTKLRDSFRISCVLDHSEEWKKIAAAQQQRKEREGKEQKSSANNFWEELKKERDKNPENFWEQLGKEIEKDLSTPSGSVILTKKQDEPDMSPSGTMVLTKPKVTQNEPKKPEHLTTWQEREKASKSAPTETNQAGKQPGKLDPSKLKLWEKTAQERQEDKPRDTTKPGKPAELETWKNREKEIKGGSGPKKK